MRRRSRFLPACQTSSLGQLINSFPFLFQSRLSVTDFNISHVMVYNCAYPACAMNWTTSQVSHKVKWVERETLIKRPLGRYLFLIDFETKEASFIRPIWWFFRFFNENDFWNARIKFPSPQNFKKKTMFVKIEVPGNSMIIIWQVLGILIRFNEHQDSMRNNVGTLHCTSYHVRNLKSVFLKLNVTLSCFNKKETAKILTARMWYLFLGLI